MNYNVGLMVPGDPGAHDWDQYFRHIVQELEGKDNHAVVERKQKLRQVIKAVVPCDITADPPIEDEFKGPYDVVTSSSGVGTGGGGRGASGPPPQ